MHPLEQVFENLYIQSESKISSYFYSVAIFVSCLMMGGLISIFIGKDLCWDMANYHYYNAYAFLHQRWNVDYWPASNIHVHLSPTLDLFAYFLINHFNPFVTTFLIGAIHGLNIWLLYLISVSILTSIENMPSPRLSAMMLTFLGIYGPVVLPGMGSFQHDNLMSIFVLAYVYLHCQVIAKRENLFSLPKIALANFLLGFAVGCKLTIGMYAVAGLASYLFLNLPLRQKCQWIFLASCFLLLGVLCSNGYWMAFLWRGYHNPIYPLMNGFFHSSSFPNINWRDTRFLPKNSWETLFYPFYFSFTGSTAEVAFRDFRFVFVYVFAILALAKWIFIKLNYSFFSKNNATPSTSVVEPSSRGLSVGPNKWLVIFFILSYLTWQNSFSIMRYAAALEMLAPLIIILFFSYLCTNQMARLLFIAGLVLCIVDTTKFSLGIRDPHYQGNYFNVVLPEMVNQYQNALVLLPYPAYAANQLPKPQNYLIPFFPPGWRFVGVPFEHGLYISELSIRKKMDGSGKILVLADKTYLQRMFAVAKSFNLHLDGKCEEINSDRQVISEQHIFLCPMKGN